MALLLFGDLLYVRKALLRFRMNLELLEFSHGRLRLGGSLC